MHQRLWDYKGEMITTEEVCKRTGIPVNTLKTRSRNGLTGDALYAPVPRNDHKCTICGTMMHNVPKGQRYCKKCAEAEKALKKSYNYGAAADLKEYKEFKQHLKEQATATAPPKKRGRPRKKQTLSEVAAEARKHGMTYGQYVALRGRAS